ncbi:hypothetical protein [Arenimonas sp. SCN 70-307]|uniref:hypothetical protein n=1 Tax=Arenimonas sp. SCN 70-307 TaxID=1660089 RepID=UPI0025BEB7A8|nr:hypothetical protein [Arenimonas sp. SCN 70-307]
MTTGKPKFAVDLTKGAQSSLAAHALLHLVDASKTYHVQENLRPALGIYNISIARVCTKTQRFCSALEQRITGGVGIESRKESELPTDDLVDYIELALYAAAEHVDDLKLIAENFYESDHSRNRCPAFKVFAKAIKDHKTFVATFANLIKHSQSRVRLFTLDYNHAGEVGRLHGYFVEGVDKGTICPHPVFHDSNKNVFSITTLAWEVICFLLRCSESLRVFLSNQPLLHGPASATATPFQDAVIAAARLPLYTFDEDHPFSQSTLNLTWDDQSWERVSSGIYGSIHNRWSHSQNMQLGNPSLAYAGDGVSRTFKITGPSRVGLQRWE